MILLMLLHTIIVLININMRCIEMIKATLKALKEFRLTLT